MTEYGGAKPDAFAGLGYDAAGLIAAAVNKANSTAPEKVLQALATIQDYKGVTGSISFIDGSCVPLKSVTILEVAGGKRNFVEQIIPRHVPSP